MSIQNIRARYPLPDAPAKPVRLGIVGLGFIAESCHLPALRFLQQCGWPVEVTGLCDVRESRRQMFLSMFPEARGFATPDNLLAAKNIDALILLTPPAITPQLIETGIRQSLPVFSEKPVSHDANELQALHALSEKTGIPVQIGYNRRYQPLADAFLQNTQRAGNLTGVEARLWRVHRREPHFYTDTMVHALDFLEYAFGPLQIEQTTWAPAVEGESLRQSVQIELSNPSGLRCRLDVRPQAGSCEEGYAADGITLHYPVQGQESQQTEEELLILRGFVHQLAAFLRLATGEQETPRCTLDDARKTCLLCEAVMSKLD